MSEFICEYCNYSTKFSSNLLKHNNTNKHRNKLIELGMISEETDHKNTNEHKMNTNEHKMNTNEHKMNTNEHSLGTQKNIKEHKMNTKIHNCIFCEKLFNTQASKRRHEKHYCKENPDITDKLMDAKNSKIQKLQKDKETLEKEKEEWKKEKEKLYEQVSQLIDKVGDTNIQQNNIILNNYGSEDLSHITDSLKNELLKIPYGAIPKMIEAVHFNDKKPENKNIMLPNKKENLLKVFQDNKWVYRDKSETISDLVDSKYIMIDQHYDKVENTPQITAQVDSNYKKFRKFYDDGDEEMIDKLKRDCELVFLNNR